MSTFQQDHALRAAKNQSLFREINERVEGVNLNAVPESGEWICECADDTCVERIPMSVREYELIRGHGAWFFVAPEVRHVWPDVERIVERNERYWVVEKLGAAGRMVSNADPRAHQPLRIRT
jgi:hypothetical protein